nr:retrovirus-related Pol polyprotein from transposon TNT 1-94 [Tanacetum cinerariifolium]
MVVLARPETPLALMVWIDILKAVKSIEVIDPIFKSSFVRKVSSGVHTSFWHDPWCGNGIPLKALFSRLYGLENNKECKVFARWCLVNGVWGGVWDWRFAPHGRATDDLTSLTSHMELVPQQLWFRCSLLLEFMDSSKEDKDVNHILIYCSRVLPVWRKVWSWWNLDPSVSFPPFNIGDVTCGNLPGIGGASLAKVLQGFSRLLCGSFGIKGIEFRIPHMPSVTKDETSATLKSFITRVENLMNLGVKIIRCDNGTEFKNRKMNQFCEVKGKFNKKADEGFFVGYSLNSKAFRVFNSRTRIMEENLHVRFSENTPNNVGIKASNDAGKEKEPERDYILLLLWTADSPFYTTSKSSQDNEFQPSNDEDIGIFDDSHDDEDVFGAEADLHNLDSTFQVSPILTTRIHKDHPLKQVIGDLHSAPQTRKMTKNLEEHGLVFKNKMDGKGIVVRNKARLVAQGHTQEEGIDYDKVFAPVAKIEAIRLFLAYALFKDFIVYQMDVKSAFLHEKNRGRGVCFQPPGFEDPDFLDKVYKVKKALYGLHQAPRAWYETLSTYLLGNEFKRGQIDKTLFIKRNKADILLVQVYVDDIIFESTKKEMYVKKASTPMETLKPLLKDEDGDEMDVHMYRSMIGYLMYLTSSRPDIMFAAYTYYCQMKVNAATHKLTTAEKPLESDGFKQIVDSINANQIKYALMMSLTIYTSCIKQFWTIVKIKTVNDDVRLQALIDGNKVVINEASNRHDHKLNDAEGTSCLSNAVIFKELARMGAKTTSWNEFSSNMASAIICLSNNQKFNFSKYILDNLKKHLKAGVAFYMFLRIGDLPTDVQDTPIPDAPSSSQPQKKHKPRRKQMMETVVLGLENEVIEMKSSHKAKIKELESRIEKLEEENMSLTNELKSFNTRVESLTINETVVDKEESSKQGRKNADIDSGVKEVAKEMIEVMEIAKVIVDGVNTAGDELNAANEKPVSDAPTNITTAQPSEATKTTVDITTASKAKGIVFHDKEESTTRTTSSISQVKDKGKAKLVEEPEILKSRKAQIALEEEVARRIKTEWNANMKKILIGIKLLNTFKVDNQMLILFEEEYNKVQTLFKEGPEMNAERIKAPRKRTRKEKVKKDQTAKKQKDDELEQYNAKKQKLEEQEEVKELKKNLEIVPDDEDGVFVNVTPLSSKPPTIMDYKIYKEEKNERF